MPRKVFISFLGATNYIECDYQKDNISYGKTRFIQEATLTYLLNIEQWDNNDMAYILLTNGSEASNWVDNGQKKRGTDEIIVQPGLKTQLEKMKLPFEIEPIKNLPDGNNEKEIWEIFERVFEKIQIDDELYFDFTHGFRYLPMLILVLGNYSKFLKKIVIKSVTYGNYEISEFGKKPGLIVDLLPLSQLQDWTYAAGQYLDSGNVDRLEVLCNNELKPILKEAKGSDIDANNLKIFIKLLGEVIAERQTCRGISIVKSKTFTQLKEYSKRLETTFIQPLNPIFDKIKQSLNDFDENENVQNGFAAANWCLSNGLYQQALTILYENLVTLVCKEMEYDWTVENERNIVNIAFNVTMDKKDESKWDLKLKEEATEEEKTQRILDIKRTIDNGSFNSLLGEYRAIKDLRNDINHSGMRNNPMSPSSLKNKITQRLNSVIEIVNTNNIN